MRPGGYVGYAGRLVYPRRGTALNRGGCRKASKPSGSLRNRDIANAEVQRFLAASRRLLLTKPFSIKELVARIRAALRRYEPTPAPRKRKKLTIGKATILLDKSIIEMEGREIPLGHYETQILTMLSQKPGEIIDRQHLLSEIWGLDNEPMNRSVDNHIVSLRRKIEDDPKKPRHIITVHGFGYKIVK